jgi:hypothetical protein
MTAWCTAGVIRPADLTMRCLSAVKMRLGWMFEATGSEPDKKSALAKGMLRRMLGSDLTKRNIIAQQIGQYQCRTAFASRKVGKQKRDDHDFSFYKCCHASSSVSVSQSLANISSLAKCVRVRSFSSDWCVRAKTTKGCAQLLDNLQYLVEPQR